MFSINTRASGHDFDKENLVTIPSRNGGYDIVKCRKCGVKGKRYTFEEVTFPDTMNKEKAMYCTKQVVTKRIKITRFTGSGKVFSNLITNSIHDVIDPPAGETTDNKGVWVMGNGEPVKVLNYEFEFID